ncbi:MAG TPA: hypothetical protein VJR27_05710 [Candidatus Saccharimonadales bacterium]|nr:hypothetical protein [Candidatus Saccharimonadales bacterium]
MTNEELFEDLKQFIATTVSQQMSQLEERLDRKLDDVQAAIADTLGTTTERLEDSVQNHEHRITRLEHRAA